MEKTIGQKQGGKRKVVRGIHGLYVSLPKRLKIDGRSRFGKAIRQLRNSLISDLGDNISTQQSLIVDRVVFKVLRLCSFEAHIFKSQGQETEKQGREYLAMSNSLRHDLNSLGLKKITSGPLNLEQYLREKEKEQDRLQGESKKKDDGGEN